VKKVLFTKELDSSQLKKTLAKNLDFTVYPALKIEIYPKERFQSKIDYNTHKFLISSQNSVKAISELKLEGDFFVVGEKTAKKLKELDFKVAHFENYARDLANYILKNSEPENWNFFCGNNRRETLFERLTPKGHVLNEILCYDSIPNPIQIETNTYDGFAFFSPLAVKTFFSENSIPESSVIFSIGETTNEEIKKHTNNNIITAEIPLLEKVIEKINRYYDTEK